MPKAASAIQTMFKPSNAGLRPPCSAFNLFRRWAGESLNSKALDQLHAYVDVMIAERCRKPGDDLLSQLIETGLDGEDLTVDDFRAIVASLAARAV